MNRTIFFSACLILAGCSPVHYRAQLPQEWTESACWSVSGPFVLNTPDGLIGGRYHWRQHRTSFSGQFQVLGLVSPIVVRYQDPHLKVWPRAVEEIGLLHLPWHDIGPCILGQEGVHCRLQQTSGQKVILWRNMGLELQMTLKTGKAERCRKMV